MKTIQLTKKELSLLIYYLDDLDDRLGDSGCNDLEKQVEKMFTDKEGKKIAQEFNKYNNKDNREDDNIDWPIPDFCLLGWLKNKIVKQTKT